MVIGPLPGSTFATTSSVPSRQSFVNPARTAKSRMRVFGAAIRKTSRSIPDTRQKS